MIENPFSRREALVGLGGLALACPSLTPSVAAVLASKRLNFLVVGDWGREGRAYQREVAANMGRFGELMNSSFTVSTGDNFYNTGVASTTDPQWVTSFEGIYGNYAALRESPWYAVLGNHDYAGDVAAQVRRTATSSWWQMPNRWFDIRYAAADLHLFFLDTIAWRGSEGFPFGLAGTAVTQADAAAQHDWLAKALAYSKARHKIVFGHFPIYSVGPHGGHGPAGKMLELDQLLRQNEVTAYVCGHDHCLYYVEYAGMHYVCSGGGSQELQHFTGDHRDYGCVLKGQCGRGRGPVWHDYIDRAGFALFSVDDLGLSFSFVDRYGAMTLSRRLFH